MDPAPRRVRTLSIKVGDVHLILPAHDVNLLIDGIARLAEGVRKAHLGRDVRHGTAEALESHLGELHALQEALSVTAHSLADPPLEITRQQNRLLRQVLADITGYQRG